MIETIIEEQLTPQQAEFWVRARQAVDMNNYPYAVSLLKALVKQLPGFLEGRRALRACEIKLNPEAKKGGLFSGMKISTSKLTSSKKDAATQLSALEDELENDPYSIPVNEALYGRHGRGLPGPGRLCAGNRPPGPSRQQEDAPHAGLPLRFTGHARPGC